MTETETQKELRLKSGGKMLEYIRNFSSTEKVIFGLLVILALVTALTMAGRAGSLFMEEVPANGGKLREGLIGLPRTINPVLAVTDVDKDMVALIYSGLLRYKSGTVVPDIAESYSISEDGLTYDFNLRKDVYFQDGKPLTADDVEFTIQKIQDPALKSPRRADWANVTINKISPEKIQFILKRPYSPFLNNMTIGILPKHIWKEVSNDQFIFSQYNIEPVGSGPYKIVSISRNSGGIPISYELGTWRGYYNEKPYIDSMSFELFEDEDGAIAAIDGGKIDNLPAVSSASAYELSQNSAQPYEIISVPLPRVFGVFFNQNQSSVLADINVRRALNMSVDRDAIVENVLHGYGTAIYGPLPPNFLNVIGDDVSKPEKGDNLESIAEAQALLERNGWKKNEGNIYEKRNEKDKSITALAFDIYTVDLPDLKETAEIIKDNWTRLGASVNIKIFESGDLYQNVIRARKYDALLFGEQIGKDRDLYAFWHSSQRNAPGLNVAMYTNSKVDGILDDIRTTSDEDKRTENYQELEKIIKDDLPAIFLYSPDFIYVVSKTLKGIYLDTIGVSADRWNSVGDWYINTEKVWSLLKNKK